MAHHRYYHSASLLADGSVLVVGGIADGDKGMTPGGTSGAPLFPEILQQ
jgi:hypothetical protein